MFQRDIFILQVLSFLFSLIKEVESGLRQVLLAAALHSGQFCQFLLQLVIQLTDRDFQLLQNGSDQRILLRQHGFE